MKKIILPILIMLSTTAIAQRITPATEQRAKEIVGKMTLEEKIDYINGINGFYIRALPQYGLPEIRMADGPQGVRNNTKSTLYPSGICLAATWNKELAYSMGAGIGLDCRARGVNIILGPGVNISRSPLAGRTFEYYGEDPYLASETAVNYIKGVQDQGIMACIKHFAANNQEWDRYNVSSDVDERTLQEIYFPTFRKAVQQADVACVMNSYNLLNSVWTSENHWLNIDILRNQWGFKGILMSDWGGTHNAVSSVLGGLDLEMPGGRVMQQEVLRTAVNNGIISEADIDRMVQHIVQSIIAYGWVDNAPKIDKQVPKDNPENVTRALTIAREGITLLKNQNNVLPLKGKVLVVGPNADTLVMGGGSGEVSPLHHVTTWQGLQKILGKKAILGNGKEWPKCNNIVVCIGFNKKTEREGEDREFSLPKKQLALLQLAKTQGKKVIAVVNGGGNPDLASVEPYADAIIMAYYPGQEGGTAIAEVLTGQINPSGRLPYTVEHKWEDNPCYETYYDTVHKSHKRVRYQEGIFVGYRGFDRNQTQALYPFGFGLSYTTFEYSNLSVEKLANGTVSVSFDLKNNGKYEGKEVCQVYVGVRGESPVVHPVKELKGYEKIMLKKGESRHVTITLDPESFSFYDVESHQWKVNHTQYEIMVGSSSADLPLRSLIIY